MTFQGHDLMNHEFLNSNTATKRYEVVLALDQHRINSLGHLEDKVDCLRCFVIHLHGENVVTATVAQSVKCPELRSLKEPTRVRFPVAA